jgi:predicted GH43/DUF377 family glycosyl hydrolase
MRLLLSITYAFVAIAALPAVARTVIPAKTGGKAVPQAEMRAVFDEVKTPFKYGIVVRGEANQLIDCPNVFRKDGRWYMVYIGITDKVGYETFLAESTDLLAWKKLGKILSFGKPGDWDQWQASGGVALADTAWGGSAELGQHDGKYWLSFIGGNQKGYEPDPLSMGMAFTTTPTRATEWTRVKTNPILSPKDADARAFERLTLYKSNIIRNEAKSLGYEFVMFYNAKTTSGFERIGMAVSDDMVLWQRYGDEPVISQFVMKDNREVGLCGDPQVCRIGDKWVMFFFGHGWKPKAFDTFAASFDLVTWTIWDGANLVEPSETWDETFAHKPWVIKHDGVVYHFYCAVGAEGRHIALATSKDLRRQ